MHESFLVEFITNIITAKHMQNSYTIYEYTYLYICGNVNECIKKNS